MNTFVLLPLQESMAQCGAGNHDQWRGYITILVINHGIIKSISILTAVIRPKINFDVDKPRDSFRPEVRWTLAIVSSFGLSLCWIWAVYTVFHTLCYKKKILIVCHRGINEFQTLCGGFNVVEIITLCYVVPC